MIVDPWLQQRSLKTHQRRNECNHPKYFKIGQWKDFAQIALFYFFPWPSGHPTPAQDEARPFWCALQFAPKTASRTSLSHHLWNPPMWKPVEPFNGAVKPPVELPGIFAEQTNLAPRHPLTHCGGRQQQTTKRPLVDHLLFDHYLFALLSMQFGFNSQVV